VFFNETVNCERYVWVILGRFFPELTEEERLLLVSARLSYCPQYISMQALPAVFGDRIISSGIWPARLPDLNPCDFFFLGSFEGRSL
jgi:hypothetical protein